jgi:hypothetical protein
MNNKRNIVLGLGALALILGVGGAMVGTADAYKGDPDVKGPNYTVERHTAMEKAFETADYTAWSELMSGKGRVTKVINKDNFAKFAEAHKLAEKGDLTGAKKIRQELGLGLKDGSGQGQKNGAGQGMNKGNCVNN